MYVLSMAHRCIQCVFVHIHINAKIQVWKYKPQTVNKVTWDRIGLWGERREGDK